MNWLLIDEKIKYWLIEDMRNGDITTDSLIDEEAVSTGRFIAKAEGVIAGIEIVKRVFFLLDNSLVFDAHISDGKRVKKGDVVATISGKTRGILYGERLALNILQKLSGIATQTAHFVDCLNGRKVRIIETRKTTPGMRMLEKYAVKVGGGSNHRFDLSEAVLIKDNHIAASGSITEAVARARENIPHTMTIEIEVESLDGLKEAIAAGADIIMLDNMSVPMMKEAVVLNNKRAILEASGNVSLENVCEIADTGVEIISVGSITHSVKALDISLRFKY